jgi:predicted ribosomally synthesized peptide with SipW-like signal peptide
MKSRLMVALAATTAIVVGLGAGSFAWFTSTATSNNNTFQAGTLAIAKTNLSDKWVEANDSTKTAVLNNLQCGDSKVYTYEFNNLKDDTTASTLDLLYKNVMKDLYESSSGNVIDPSNDKTVLANANTKKANLLNAMLFDLTIKRVGNRDGFLTADDTNSGKNKGTAADVVDENNIIGQQVVFNAKNLNELISILSEARKMTGKAIVTDTYTIKATLPQQIFEGTGLDSLTGRSSLAGTEQTVGAIVTDNDYREAPGGFVINTYAAQNVANAAYESPDGTLQGSVSSAE